MIAPTRTLAATDSQHHGFHHRDLRDATGVDGDDFGSERRHREHALAGRWQAPGSVGLERRLHRHARAVGPRTRRSGRHHDGEEGDLMFVMRSFATLLLGAAACGPEARPELEDASWVVGRYAGG